MRRANQEGVMCWWWLLPQPPEPEEQDENDEPSEWDE
jgi:hypothetical protein